MRGLVSGNMFEPQWLAGAALVVAVAASTPAAAQTRSFDVAAQPASSGIPAFARQAGVQILASGNLVAGKQTQQVKGSYSVEEGLRLLLDGTGLTADFKGSGQIITIRAASRLASAAEAESVIVDDVVVTGSLIRGANNPTNHVITIDRDAIERSGVGTTQEVLQRLTQNFQGGGSEGASETGSFGQGSLRSVNTGQTGVNLRGLNSRATLTLVNGRRLAPAAQGLISADVSLIPLSAVERIEVLADGASAIYGADAVAGVVNVILRKDFQGAETSVRYGAPTEGGTQEYRLSQSFGDSWSTGSAFLSGEYYERTALSEAERSELTTPAIGLADFLPHTKRYGLVGHVEQEFGPKLKAYADGLFGRTDFSYYEGRTSSYPNLLREPQNQSYSVTGGLTYDLASNWSVDLSASTSESRQKSPRIGYAATGVVSETSYNVAGEKAESLGVLVNGKLFDLPAGALSIAFGADYLNSHFHQDVFSNLYSGVVTQARDSRREVYSVFGEVLAPIVSPEMNVPLVHSLTLSAAGRYDDYSDFGDTFNPKVGISWEPVEGLALRSSYSTSFRAPSSFESVRQNGGVPGLLVYSTFVAPSGTGQVPVLILSGSQFLGPERSDNFTAGFTATPPAIPGLKLDVSYFNISYKDRIDAPSFSLNALNLPSLQPFVTYYASSADVEALFAAYKAQGASSAFVGRTDASGINYVYSIQTQNMSSSKVDGIDVALSYGFDVANGRMTLDGAATYMMGLKTAVSSTAPAVDLIDTFGNPVDLRARGGVSWARDGLVAAAAVNYVDGYRDLTGATPLDVSSYTTADLTLAYRFGDASPTFARGLTVRASVLNVFDADAPYVTNGSSRSHFDPAYADVRGRFASIELSKAW
jgi:iron complex outermembrane receptor protein